MILPFDGQVTYGITLLVYLVSIITPSIYTPLQIIGAHHSQPPSSVRVNLEY